MMQKITHHDPQTGKTTQIAVTERLAMWQAKKTGNAKHAKRFKLIDITGADFNPDRFCGITPEPTPKYRSITAAAQAQEQIDRVRGEELFIDLA